MGGNETRLHAECILLQVMNVTKHVHQLNESSCLELRGSAALLSRPVPGPSEQQQSVQRDVQPAGYFLVRFAVCICEVRSGSSL